MTVRAVVDCGSNSTRLLVVDSEGNEVARDLRITRMGEGVHASGQLSGEAIDRTVASLRDFKEVMDTHGVDQTLVIATSAARDAANRDAFFEAAEAVLGVRPRLLSGHEEAQFSVAGATAGLEDPPYLIVDIGGGSTELALWDGVACRSVSLDIGAGRLTEMALHGDPYSSAEVEKAKDLVREMLAPLPGELTNDGEPPALVGVGGTVTSVAMIDLALDSYDTERIHHHVLTATAIGDILDELSSATQAEREAMVGMPPGRAAILTGGAVILDVLMERFAAVTCLVSERDILDGALASM